jgi:hypothetical protein
MADYPKTRTTEKPVEMSDGKWEQTTNLPGLPNITKYTRWYGDTRIDLYNKRGDNIYTYTIIREPDMVSFHKIHAPSLQRAQKFFDRMMTSSRRSE